MLPFLKHLFVPNSKNNHRAKILHHTSLFTLIIFILSLSFFSLSLEKSKPQVLGISYSISDSRLIELTNKIRKERKLSPLSLDARLSNAAKRKAYDMFKKNYWAHFAPDGTTPWDFIKGEGYEYTYAGENLAKGFTDSNDVMVAWMNSPSHRENILSDKYRDIGFAIGEGKLSGENTILVVEMFGARDLVSSKLSEPKVLPNENLALSEGLSRGVILSEKNTSPKLDINFATKSISLSVLVLLFATFVLDLFIIRKKNIPRVVGHNLDHIILIAASVILIILTTRGGVL